MKADAADWLALSLLTIMFLVLVTFMGAYIVDVAFGCGVV